MENKIKIRGARQHNLKNVNLDIPKDKLVVFTGVSGSGKSSLAFDTIYAEGQRRYVESLSTYARQFLGIMEKPDVDLIEGLSPSISIDQKTTSRNPRSTVGTVTEVYDYLRLLFARVGHPHCPICGREIAHQSLDQIIDAATTQIKSEVKANKKGWFMILSPVVSARKGEFTSLFENLKAKGFKQIRVDGIIKDLSEELILFKTNKHNIDVVIDKLGVNEKDLKDKIYSENLRSRLSDSISQALNLSEGNVTLARITDKGFEMPPYPRNFEDHLFSEKFSCPIDNIQIPEIEPRTFSFNNPQGACPSCTGLGRILKVEPSLVFSDELTIKEGAILPYGATFEHETWFSRLIETVALDAGINVNLPVKHLRPEEKDLLLYGTGDKDYEVRGKNRFGKETKIWQRFYGIVNDLERRYKESTSDYVKTEIEKYMRSRLCESCQGARLKKEALGVTIDGQSISDVTKKSISETLEWIDVLGKGNILSGREMEIGKLVLREIVGRLGFLKAVGLEYLNLGRESATLSGGEAQRIRLASQIGSGLTGVLYVLDEPTIGLHQRDNDKLIKTLKQLRDLGNSVVVVEHDAEMMKESDYVVDFGPGAGKLGGEVISVGTVDEIQKDPKSITGAYLSGRRKISISIPKAQRLNLDGKIITDGDETIKVVGASQFNLKNLDVEFPLGKLVVISGVSGSGKSTLLVETLYPALQEELNPFFRGEIGAVGAVEGIENIDKVILIDQSPIGRTPRSNPATYTKVFDLVRDVYAATREARGYGFKKGRFSFNTKGGRCENCEGQGQIKIEMQFMSDIWVTCEVCNGKRYNSQTLEVSYKGKNIAEVLDMTIEESVEFFHNHPKIMRKLETLLDVGLGYMDLGQPATTLSGGEAQRVKLATELSKRATGRTLYILDEPTTGLHFADVEKLLTVLKILVSRGNTVIVIEHNLDVIKGADWVIDLGPEGGDGGGHLVGAGKPSDIAKLKSSYTGQYLKDLL